jgi:hypothetical protein
LEAFESSSSSSSSSSRSSSRSGIYGVGGGGVGMQRPNAASLPAVRRAGLPVVALWAAAAPFWDLHAGCPDGRSRSGAAATPDCASWPYPSPVRSRRLTCFGMPNISFLYPPSRSHLTGLSSTAAAGASVRQPPSDRRRQLPGHAAAARPAEPPALGQQQQRRQPGPQVRPRKRRTQRRRQRRQPSAESLAGRSFGGTPAETAALWAQAARRWRAACSRVCSPANRSGRGEGRRGSQ